MDTNNQPTTSTVNTAPSSEVSGNTPSAWFVAMAIGGIIGVIASIVLTTMLIANDPSSTAALAYIFTVPFGLLAGVLLGVAVRWRFPKT